MSGTDNTSHTVRRPSNLVQQQGVSPNDSVLIWLSGGFAIYTLPKASTVPGRIVHFIVDNGGAGSCQVFAPAGDTADGSPSTLSWNATGFTGRLTVVSDGVNGWWSISGVGVSRV